MTRTTPDSRRAPEGSGAADMARKSLAEIDAARNKMRDARNSQAEAEATINLAMARLHAYFAIHEETKP